MPNASKLRKSPPRGYVITANGLKRSNTYFADITPPNDDEVSVCLRWMDAFAKPTKACMRTAYSDTLKHIVEEWANLLLGKPSGESQHSFKLWLEQHLTNPERVAG